ncbi:MAG TPA: GAF domain-containing sensor histidine kinase, partial [Acidimicrobiales bacterium]|nr:GAF domain-containing sensor histidine kinase [Acidimicrobiales bacterium]
GRDAPAPGAAAEVLAALSAAVRAVTLGSTLDRVLAELAARARDLVGARYAAIGIPEPDGDEFAQFITVGMSDELIAELGPLPRTHGLLDAMLVDPSPYRTPDITRDPRFRGWWPAAHPEMRSFLGVPIVSAGDIVGAFYLTDKEDGPAFTSADEDAVVLLSSHAAIAIDQARLFEDSRELALVQERARLARELHDAMSQSLFSLQLAAETATRLLEDDPAAAAEQLTVVRTLSGRLAGELRGTVEGLRPADLERDGLAAALRDHLRVAARAHEVPLDLDIDDLPDLDPTAEHQVLRVAQEAVTNALRHAGPCRVQVTLRAEGRSGPAGAGEPADVAGTRGRGSGDGDGTGPTGGTATSPMDIVLQVIDDGKGFDPDTRGVRARRLGLTSMHERAASLGGALTVTSSPGNGTTVELRFPA